MPASPLRLSLLVFAAAVLPMCSAVALPTTSVLVENLVNGNTSAGAVLTGVDGLTPLTAGTAANGDGTLVVLGYFSGSTSSAGFNGTWIPLTGPASANTGVPVGTIGDTGSNASGPYGHFTFLHNFDTATPSTAQNLPAVGTRLAVAVYSGIALGASAHFNIATNDAWRWKAPTLLPDFVTINLNDAGTIWLGGAGSARKANQPAATFPGVPQAARLVNISTRGFVGTGDALMIPGFVVGGTGTKRVLVRAIGPTLAGAPFGVAGTIADPVLRVVQQSNGAELALNDNWGSQADAASVAAAMSAVGAFPIPADSLDAAVLLDLPAGLGFSAQVTGTAGGTGVAIAEVYVVGDAPGDAARLVNISTRGFVGTGDSVMIPGFVLGPGAPRRLLIRAVGPTLAAAPFNLAGTLANPAIQVFTSAGGAPVAGNDDWGSAGQATVLAATASAVGAFPLTPDSADAALIFTASGNTGYTVQVSGAAGSTGIVITEIYELP